MSQEGVFESLTNNAIDFLERSVGELDASPKYSVIHFCAGLEMLLKARLMREHWSLVVAKPELAKLSNFKSGDFISVTMSDARVRLKNVADIEISDDAFKSFDVISKHRNKIIHFYHEGVENENKIKADIAREQCVAWHHIYSLINTWSDVFSKFSSQFDRLDIKMRDNRKYLQVIFDNMSSKINEDLDAGVMVVTCVSCGFKSAYCGALDDAIFELDCSVCRYEGVLVNMPCPHCEKDVLVESGGYDPCASCGQPITTNDQIEYLVDHEAAHQAAKDCGDFNSEQANCGLCEGYQSVVRRGEQWFCCACHSVFSEIESCDWCNENNTGDMSDSFLSGCSHCDGRLGWNND